jgi:hypothetical protein
MKAFALRINRCGERFKRTRELLWLPYRSIVRGHFEEPSLCERPHIFYRSLPIPEFATPSACVCVCVCARAPSVEPQRNEPSTFTEAPPPSQTLDNTRRGSNSFPPTPTSNDIPFFPTERKHLLFASWDVWVLSMRCCACNSSGFRTCLTCASTHHVRD